MPKEKALVIVPVILHPVANADQPNVSPNPSAVCTITLANAENHFSKWRGRAHHSNNHEGVDQPMRQDYTSVKNIYIICGKTDMRKGIDGLAV